MDGLKIDYVPISEITPYKNNARKHQEADLKAIKASIEEFGFLDALGVWGEKNIIIEGHGRYQAAKELGYNELPVVHLDWLTDEQRRAYALAHNKTAELSEWDPALLDLELNDITEIDMASFGFELNDNNHTATGEAEEDNYDPEPPTAPQSEPGQVYKLGEHRLMCGDSTRQEDVQKLMDGAEADLVITDPPYNVKYGTQSCQTNRQIKNDNMSDDEFFLFCKDAFANMNKALKDTGAFYIWYANVKTIQVYEALMANGLKPRAPLTWVKDRMVLDFNDYHTQIEPCIYSWKGTSHYFTDDRTQKTLLQDDTPDLSKLKKEDLLDIVKTFYEYSDAIHEERPKKSDLHPTMKPVKLIGRLICNSSRKGDSVLDLFGGSGTTLIACEQLNRKCYMMEYDPKYVDVIIDRWEQLTGKKAEKII